MTTIEEYDVQPIWIMNSPIPNGTVLSLSNQTTQFMIHFQNPNFKNSFLRDLKQTRNEINNGTENNISLTMRSNQSLSQILAKYYEFMNRYSPALMPLDVRSTIHELETILYKQQTDFPEPYMIQECFVFC